MKSYRFVGEEAEALGRRLDSVRNALDGAKSVWSKHHWKQTLDQLLFQWRQLPALHDGDAQTTIIPRWTIDYDYYEIDNGVKDDFADRLYTKHFKAEADLDASWEAHRSQRLAKAQ